MSGRSLITGLKDNGKFGIAAMTQENHLEVAIHSPRLPFGSIHAERMTPIFQTDSVYGLNLGQVNYGSSLSGAVAGADSFFSISTGTTIYSQAYLQSRKRLRYRSGQGVIGRFTALYTSPVTSSYQVVGFGHAEDGVYFGYKDLEFGILWSSRGKREVQTLTITTASTTAQNVTVTLNGVAFTVAVTNSANIQRTVYEISQGIFTGWKAAARGATIIFVADAVGNKAGAFSLTATTAIGTFAETQAGQATTEVFIPQTDWNGDKLDGTGSSEITADWTKGNVFQIDIQYLGFGVIVFKVETATNNSNNAEFVTVHTIKNPNTRILSNFGNPSFPFSMAVYSTGSTTNLTVKCASFAGFIEGEKFTHGNRFTYTNTLTNVGASNFHALFTFRNLYYYGNRVSQAVVNLLSITAAIKHTSPVIIYLIKNATLLGNPNFTNYSSTSCTMWDTASTTCTYSDNNQVVWSGSLGETGQISFEFADEITLQPGESLTVAAKSTTGTPSYVVAAINTREAQ